MRFFLLLLALLSGGHAAFAQATPALPQPEALRSFSAATDTVAAIRRLFAAKRKTRTIVVVGTLAGGSAIVIAGFSESKPYADAAAAVFGVEILVAAITELVLYRRYRYAHEQKVIASYQAHHAPRWLARKLHLSHFQPATSEPGSIQ